jgi:ParB family chromosome partitioning protein
MSGSQLIDGAKRRPAFDADADELTIVGIDTNDGAEHPLWDKRIHLPLDPAMLASVDADGIVMPIRVAKQGGVVYVVAGRQRVRHAREVNRLRAEKGIKDRVLVPCVGERMGDVERQAHIASIENEIRRDVPTLEKAAEAQRRIDRSVPIARVAQSFGVSVATVQSWLKSNSLSPEVRASIEAGHVSITAAAKWADLSPKDQVAALELALADSGGKRVSVAKATRTVNPDAPVRPKRAELIALAERDSVAAVGIRIALGLDPMPECKAAAE